MRIWSWYTTGLTGEAREYWGYMVLFKRDKSNIAGRWQYWD